MTFYISVVPYGICHKNRMDSTLHKSFCDGFKEKYQLTSHKNGLYQCYVGASTREIIIYIDVVCILSLCDEAKQSRLDQCKEFKVDFQLFS